VGANTKRHGLQAATVATASAGLTVLFYSIHILTMNTLADCAHACQV
jgi:hypothetical protein